MLTQALQKRDGSRAAHVGSLTDFYNLPRSCERDQSPLAQVIEKGKGSV